MTYYTTRHLQQKHNAKRLQGVQRVTKVKSIKSIKQHNAAAKYILVQNTIKEKKKMISLVRWYICIYLFLI